MIITNTLPNPTIPPMSTSRTSLTSSQLKDIEAIAHSAVVIHYLIHPNLAEVKLVDCFKSLERGLEPHHTIIQRLKYVLFEHLPDHIYKDVSGVIDEQCIHLLPPAPRKEMFATVYVCTKQDTLPQQEITTLLEYKEFVKSLEPHYKNGSLLAVWVTPPSGTRQGFYPENYVKWEYLSKSLLGGVMDGCPCPNCSGHIKSTFNPCEGDDDSDSDNQC